MQVELNMSRWQGARRHAPDKKFGGGIVYHKRNNFITITAELLCRHAISPLTIAILLAASSNERAS